MVYQNVIDTFSVFISFLSLFCSFLNLAVILFGGYFAYRQVKSAQDSLRAQTFLKLYEEWKNPELYKSIRYIDELRQDWKLKKAVTDWGELAEEWVSTHARIELRSDELVQRKLANEWNMRRTASQFLSKMGTLIETNALPEDDFFGLNPEVGRQLSVLIPIEIAIQKYWAKIEKSQIAPWDLPVPKWEFNKLWVRYQKWYQKKGTSFTLHPIDWNKS